MTWSATAEQGNKGRKCQCRGLQSLLSLPHNWCEADSLSQIMPKGCKSLQVLSLCRGVWSYSLAGLAVLWASWIATKLLARRSPTLRDNFSLVLYPCLLTYSAFVLLTLYWDFRLYLEERMSHQVVPRRKNVKFSLVIFGCKWRNVHSALRVFDKHSWGWHSPRLLWMNGEEKWPPVAKSMRRTKQGHSESRY